MSEFISGVLVDSLADGMLPTSAAGQDAADKHASTAVDEAPDDELERLADSPVFGKKIGAQTDVTTNSPDRQPRIIEKKKTVNSIPRAEFQPNNYGQDYQDVTTEDIFSGQYHEVNPGQYHEVNPGQYTETNPGQYREVNPGQYTEVNPGQYEEKHPGQPLEIDDVRVDVAHTDELQIYNVQANAGNYILGEVGKINRNNGQIEQGVRYTIEGGSLNQDQIDNLISKYFGTQTT